MFVIDMKPAGKTMHRQQRDLLGTLFLALGFLLAFALYAPVSWTGWLGRALSTVTKGLFGSLAFVMPVALLAFSFMYFIRKEIPVISQKIGGLFLLYVLAASLLSLVTLPYKTLLEVMTPLPKQGSAGIHIIQELWRFGRFPDMIRSGNKLSGGLTGGLIAHPLERVAGLTGALILLFAVLLTVLVFAFGLSPSGIIRRAQRIVADPLESQAQSDHPADKESDKRGLFARLFGKKDLSDVSSSDDKAEGISQLNLEYLPDVTGKGPAGWESLYTHKKEGSSDQDGQNPSFAKPPLGYKPVEKTPKPYTPLQGTPYLFSSPRHKTPEDRLSPGAQDGFAPASGLRTPSVEFGLSSKADEPMIGLDRHEDDSAKPTAEKRKPIRTYKPEQLSMLTKYQPPPLNLLREDSGMKKTPQEIRQIRELGRKLEETLDNFGIDAHIVNYTTGPTITRFELSPGPGIKVSRIVNLSDDIALSLAAMGVRIEAPIPGKAAIGIEVPNKKMRPVLLRSLLESVEFKQAKSPLVAALGRDVGGEAILCDLSKMPHLLIAGATGSGKSVCINSILISILYRSSPAEVRMLMIDPKIVELNVYNGIPHLLQPVVTNPEKAYGVLNYAISEMERRYRLFADKRVRDITSYNAAIRKLKDPDDTEQPIPNILIVIDELADLMAITQHQVESAISRLMAKARAVGIHVIIATQRPSVDVITGVIKANIPSRIAFAVASQVDSRTIIDSGGAEKLLGKGDMLYYPLGSIKAIRGQGSFVTNSEVERVLSFIKSYYPENYDDKVAAAIENPDGGDQAGAPGESGEDELLMEALRVVVESDYAAVSLLQRKLQVGYPRAARIVDRLNELGYVGPFEGSKPRKVLISRDQYESLCQDGDDGDGDDNFA
ncbi:MAG TPA: DNA translocase FtsK [Clostridia bacterium]|nr:DNA translocase FtsK [Clostridia bacterium]